VYSDSVVSTIKYRKKHTNEKQTITTTTRNNNTVYREDTVTWLETLYNVRCSYSAKQLVSEVGTREQMRLEHVFER